MLILLNTLLIKLNLNIETMQLFIQSSYFSIISLTVCLCLIVICKSVYISTTGHMLVTILVLPKLEWRWTQTWPPPAQLVLLQPLTRLTSAYKKFQHPLYRKHRFMLKHVEGDSTFKVSCGVSIHTISGPIYTVDFGCSHFPKKQLFSYLILCLCHTGNCRMCKCVNADVEASHASSQQANGLSVVAINVVNDRVTDCLKLNLGYLCWSYPLICISWVTRNCVCFLGVLYFILFLILKHFLFLVDISALW